MPEEKDWTSRFQMTTYDLGFVLDFDAIKNEARSQPSLRMRLILLWWRICDFILRRDYDYED